MKVFAMLMLRCTLIMLLFSFLQNETLATLDEWKKWEKWKTSSDSLVEAISKAQVPISLDELSGIRTEFNTFIFEVELELIKKSQ
uniref:Secreted protein n=1 Tax=Globodera pallida TaxID=36090 RepID=A0A183CB33_GLOPA